MAVRVVSVSDRGQSVAEVADRVVTGSEIQMLGKLPP